jgi:DNA-binding CsgD family transcriptional regulator/N-acetylneuraminic acid mutarotase
MPNFTEELSERELEILRLVATGASNKEIASQLYISANTVKVHLRNIFAKINASSRTEAAMYAVNAGLVQSAAAIDEQSVDSLPPPQAFAESASRGERKAAGGIGWNVFLILGLVVLCMAAIAAYALSRQSAGQAAQSAAAPTQAESPWRALAPLPAARFGLAAAVYRDQIYAIAGETSAGVTGALDCYDPPTDTWQPRASKPVPVADLSAAVLGGKIYLPGGRLESGEVTDILEIYDPLQDRWSQGAALPAPRSAYALVEFDGKLYLFGGWDGRAYVSDVYVYDPGDDAWSLLPAMESGRGFAGAAVSGRQIVVAGGYDGKKALTRVDIFQPDLVGSSEPAWKTGADLPGGRYAMGMTSVADYVYLIGGNGRFEKNTIALVFSPQINQWQSLPPPPSLLGAHMAVVDLGSYLYNLGGVLNRAPLEANLSYRAIYTVVLPIIP